jgi:hypothetical protein
MAPVLPGVNTAVVVEDRRHPSRCAFCGEPIGVDEAVAVLMPNRPVRRLGRYIEEDLPDDSIAVHERCYDERDLTPRT